MGSGKGCAVCAIVGVLVGLGALNWGLVGIFQVDLIGRVFGASTGLARAIYGLIGVAGLLKLLSLVKACPCSRTTCQTK